MYQKTRNIQKYWWSAKLTLDEYYRTDEWRQRSRRQLKRRPFCVCGTKATDAHHKRYWRYGLNWRILFTSEPLIIKKPIFYHERWWHLQSLCRACHQAVHA